VYSGSGTVFSLEGLILTNHHLLVSSGGGTLIKLCGVGFTVDPSQPPRIQYAAKVLASDTEHDMAVLRITESLDGSPLPPSFKTIDLSQIKHDSLALGIGDPVYIGGYPGIGQQTFTFTEGVVSGRVSDLIKTNALIDSGTSGGSAFDSHGRLIGIPSAAIRGEIGGSLGFIISGEAVDNFLTDYYNGKNLVTK
jgi:serine protease Do